MSFENTNELNLRYFDDPKGMYRLGLGQVEIEQENHDRLVNPGTVKNSVIIANGNIIEKFKTDIVTRPVSKVNVEFWSQSGEKCQKYSPERKTNKKGNIHITEEERVLSQIKIPEKIFSTDKDELNIYIVINNYWKNLYSPDVNRFKNNIILDFKGFSKLNSSVLDKIIQYNGGKYSLQLCFTSNISTIDYKIVGEVLEKISSGEVIESKVYYDYLSDNNKFDRFLKDKIKDGLKNNYLKGSPPSGNHSIDSLVNRLNDDIFGTYIGKDLSDVSSNCSIEFYQEIVFSKIWCPNQECQVTVRKNSIKLIGNFSKLYFICLLKCNTKTSDVVFRNNVSNLFMRSSNIMEVTSEFLPSINYGQLNEFIKDIVIYKELINLNDFKYDKLSVEVQNEIKSRLFGKKNNFINDELLKEDSDDVLEMQKKINEISYDINSQIHNKIRSYLNLTFDDHLRKNTYKKPNVRGFNGIDVNDLRFNVSNTRNYLGRQQSHNI